MKHLLNCSLFMGLLLSGVPAMAQWGNTSAREKADVLGRDLSLSALFLDQHDGVFWEYTTGDPYDENNSILIEMLGSPTNAIVTNSVQNFIDTTGAYRGAFRTRNQILTRVQRAGIVETMRDMETRTSPAPIGYISFPFFNQYLYWTDRNSDGRLDLDDIDNMRSDAVVEFAYTFRGFPIVGNGLVRTTIINDPFVFQYLASLTSGISQTGVLLPSDQLQMMIPATVAAPELTIYDANGAPLASGAASSMTAISAIVTDIYSGPGRLEVWLGEPQTGSLVAVNNEDWDSITHTYTSSDSGLSGMGSLADGQYTVRAVDQAGNTASSGFILASGNPNAETEDDKGGAITDVIPSSRCIVIHATDTASGIASITFSGAGFTKTMNYACGVPAKSTDVYSGAFCSLVENSTYTYTVTNCAGKQRTSPQITISTSTKGGVICVAAPSGNYCGTVGSLSDSQLRTYGMRMRVCMTAWPSTCNGFCDVTGWDNVTSVPTGSAYCGTGPSCCRVITWDPPLAYREFWVSNSTSVTSRDSGSYEFAITTTASEGQVSIATLNSPNFTMIQGQVSSGTIDVAQVGQGYPDISPDGAVKVNSPFTRLQLFLQSIADFLVGLAQNLLRPSSPYSYYYKGSDAIFNSTTTLTFTYADTVNTDTTTVRIYMFDGVSWSSAGIINQSVSYATAGSTTTLTISGDIDRTGLYATLYQASDSSAPITTLAFQGTARSFDGALFVSTDTYLVLTATDPVVNGFASTVASVTYRIDPTPSSAFTIYDSSIPVSLGTHVIEYRSLDYAGNAEAIKTSTFTATAGSAMRLSDTATVPGTFLNGFLGSGAKFEIESRAEDSLTLLISSTNRQGMLAVDNSGEVGIGVTPQANLNIGAGEIGLQLRSGNSTSAVTSNQIAFGYNGDYSMRHLLRTEHSTATHGNKMDFLVWNTGAGSTTTLASLNVLSLQGIATASGGSFHVQPVGEPDAEVEVSNGLSTGGGTMQRLQVVTPSSRRFKTDIKELSEKDEDRALLEVAGLKHARFRYKSRRKDGSLIEDPSQPVHIGLIYEDAPESIRDGDGAISTTERMVNVEMALRASMRQLEELQARYKQLKARRKKP